MDYPDTQIRPYNKVTPDQIWIVITLYNQITRCNYSFMSRGVSCSESRSNFFQSVRKCLKLLLITIDTYLHII